MDPILDLLANRGGHLIDRLTGPLNFRLFVMPTVVTVFAILADRRDARQGRPTLRRLGPALDPAERRWLLRSAFTEAGKVFVVAIVLDTVYQLWVLRWVYPGEVLLVALVSAIVPYVLVRGAIIPLVRRLLSRL